MRRALRSLPLLFVALAAAGALTFGQAVSAAGTWTATDVPYAPWTIQLMQDGTKVTGTMEQNGGLRGPVDIYEGSLNGSAISFKAKSPDGARAITFTGTIAGDELTLNRSTQDITGGSQGGTGLFGTNAAPRFTIHRAASMLASPGQHWAAAEGVAFAPWTFDLKFEGNTVTGSVGQSSTDAATGNTTNVTGPYPISAGKVDAGSIDFNVQQGEKVVAFHGIRSGEKIAFTRVVESTGGNPGLNGILGVGGAKQFTAILGAPEAATSRAVAPSRGSMSSATVAQTGPSGRWTASPVPNATWIFTLAVDGATLSGFINQNGARNTVSIAGGKVNGTTISFTVLSPDAERLIIFDGRVNGNEISFVRRITALAGGGRGGNDLYGASAPLQFIATRAAAFASMTGASAVATSGPTRKIEYKGVSIDVTSIQSLANYDAVVESLHRQIDIVDAAMPDREKNAFLKSIPMLYAPGVASGADNAAYGNGRVVLTTLMFSSEKPVILHELMHAYHDQKAPGGFSNPEILKLYEQAKSSGNFPEGSYLLSRVGEYFAMMSSVYLYGSAARDPFTRDAIKQKQPDCYAWLLKEFGPR